ncbi:GspE/PulE family protein [Planctomycetota bacterium]
MKLPFSSHKDDGYFSESQTPHPADGTPVGLSDLDGDDSVRGLSDLYCPDPEPACEATRLRDVADVLLEMGRLAEDVYARLRQQQTLEPLCDTVSWLEQNRAVAADDIVEAKAALYGLAFEHIQVDTIQPDALQKLPVDFIQSSNVVPLRIEENVLVVASADPGNVFTLEDVKRQAQMDVRVVVSSMGEIEAVIASMESEEEVDYNLDEIINDMTEVEVVQDEVEDSEDLEKMAGQSPVIKFVNFLISNAIREGASDIHIEPKEKVTRIRYRIDGVLFEAKQAPSKMHPAITSRIKIMANLDISERRLPQDGKVSVIVGRRAVDLRVSTLPTSHGEKTVIRVLDSQSIVRGLEDLGMETEVCQQFSEQIKLPHGVFLVTGPTGSGKSTTLYTALSQMDGDTLNVSTVEDPVEYQLDFCNQVQVNEKVGLTFAGALRSLLRQDPDIIMLGEIRDNETARVAIQAALTGHLVMSTLHTNDAPSSVTRLVNIGIDAYLIAASLNAVLAQRLVRRICTHCKEPYQVPENKRRYVETAGIDPEGMMLGTGCDACRGSGYAGRLGIYELLIISDTFRDMINKDASVTNMRRAFHESGQPGLFDDGMKKVEKGLTTVEEVLRVTEVYGQSEQEVFIENED